MRKISDVYITGLEIDELCAELTAFIPGRELDDDGKRTDPIQRGSKRHPVRITNF